MYPISYDNGSPTPSLTKIKDPNGFVLYQKGSPTASAFYPGTFDMISQIGTSDYVLWESKSDCSYQGDGYFEFTFGPASTFSWPANTVDPTSGFYIDPNPFE